jgi:hypothetical protein
VANRGSHLIRSTAASRFVSMLERSLARNDRSTTADARQPPSVTVQDDQ